MSKIEKCPNCGATSPLVRDGVCGACTVQPISRRTKEFIDDWNAMVASISQFSDKYDLPKGELIFPAPVLDNLRDVAQENILGTLIHMGVRIRFGRFEQAEIFRQY